MGLQGCQTKSSVHSDIISSISNLPYPEDVRAFVASKSGKRSLFRTDPLDLSSKVSQQLTQFHQQDVAWADSNLYHLGPIVVEHQCCHWLPSTMAYYFWILKEIVFGYPSRRVLSFSNLSVFSTENLHLVSLRVRNSVTTSLSSGNP